MNLVTHVIKLALVALLLAACASMPQTATPTLPEISFTDPEDVPTSTFTDARMRQAEQQYQLYCAHCHGYNGEGQAVGAPGETAQLGLRLVPPHDSSGDTWRYADPVLVEVIKNGIQNPLTHYPMAGFGAALSDEEIMALLDYMRLWWTEEQRAYQAAVTANYLARQTDSAAPMTPLPELP